MAAILIIGSGVVGQATGKGMLAKGHQVTFSDINLETIRKLQATGYQACSTDEVDVDEFNTFILTVSTPTVDKKINLGFLESAAAMLGKKVAEKAGYFLVVLRSTVIPGTSENLVIPIIEKYSGKKVGEDFGFCMNPEYLREKSSSEDFLNPRIVVIGAYDQRSYDLLRSVYEFDAPATYVFPSRLKLKEAEMQKYVHNLFNALKISFFNEMRQLSEAIGGIDTDKIFSLVVQSAEASWNPQYGTLNLGPYGGSCLPKDTVALATWAEESHAMALRMVLATIGVNSSLSTKY